MYCGVELWQNVVLVVPTHKTTFFLTDITKKTFFFHSLLSRVNSILTPFILMSSFTQSISLFLVDLC
jgi:hypothetical protein